MSIIAWCILGVLMGLVFNRLEHQPAGQRVIHPILGLFGAVVGGMGYHIIAGLGSDFYPRSLAVATVSAIVVLLAFKWTRRRQIA